jgi:hypothetical protein
MPHFGLIDEDALGPVEGPLMRAKLHIRGGRRRLRQGKLSYGIITLYDALISAMQWYVASPERMKGLRINKDDNMNDDKTLFNILLRSGVVDGSFDYEAFDILVENALYDSMSGFYYKEMLESYEAFMTQLGVLPFDENELPPEDPSTL